MTIIRTLVALICCSGFASAANAQQVPSALLGIATSAAPVDFVAALVEANVPAGLEVLAGEDVLSAKPDVPDDPNGRVALATVISAFNGRRSDYTAQLTNGVVVVRPVSSRAPFLDQEITIPADSVNGILAAQRRVFSVLRPSLASGAIMGSTFASAYDMGEYAVFVFDGRPALVRDLLSAIARSAPNQAWFAITRRQRDTTEIVEYGFIHANGSLTKAGLSRP
jgi:hypothetical protein